MSFDLAADAAAATFAAAVAAGAAVLLRLGPAVAPAYGSRAAADVALNDPGLRVAYPAPAGDWRDHRGQLVVLPERDVTMVWDAGEIVAALVHSSPARTDHGSVSGAVSAARLLLDTERIEAGALARVNDLRAARQQVAEAADAARASLERPA